MTGEPALPCSVVLTGQLRMPEMLLASVRSWMAMRDDGVISRVILVTWQEEADKAQELCAQLAQLGVELLTPPMPPIRGIGHVWPQTLALLRGLDLLANKDAWVLKTRADLAIDPAFLRSLLTTPGYLDPASPSPVFRSRIWLPWFELTKPFYVSDECFLGRAGDLRKLCNFDESYSLLWDIGCGITHIRRFIHPFRAQTNLFEPFLERFTYAGHFEPDRWDRVASLLDDDEFLTTLAAYYTVLATHFRIASPDGAIDFRAWSSGAPQPPMGAMADSFTTQHALDAHGGHLFAHSESWLHAALSGSLTGPLAGRFADACKRVCEAGLALELPRQALQYSPAQEERVA